MTWEAHYALGNVLHQAYAVKAAISLMHYRIKPDSFKGDRAEPPKNLNPVSLSRKSDALMFSEPSNSDKHVMSTVLFRLSLPLSRIYFPIH